MDKCWEIAAGVSKVTGLIRTLKIKNASEIIATAKMAFPLSTVMLGLFAMNITR